MNLSSVASSNWGSKREWYVFIRAGEIIVSEIMLKVGTVVHSWDHIESWVPGDASVSMGTTNN